MKISAHFLFVLLFVAAVGVFTSPSIATAQDTKAKTSATKEKARVHILATGGTIAGAQMSRDEIGYKSGTFNVDDLVASVPQIKDIANLTGEQVVNIGSQDMNDQVWMKLAKRVNEVLQSNDYDAVIITHGTDTMEETSYYLNLVVKSDKPVVLVGAMRPATAVSADGPANLYNAVAVASDPRAKKRGVLVVMNDEIHNARNVRKINTINVEAFSSGERGPEGLVNTGKIAWADPSSKRHTSTSEFSSGNIEKLPRVDIFYAHANMSPDLFEAAVKAGAKGLVVAGVGDGNMTEESLKMLEKLRKKGILVIRSTRVPNGPVLRNSEVDDDKFGFVASGEFNPSKSRILAKLALTKTNDPRKVQEMFTTY